MYDLGLVHGLTQLKLVSGHHLHSLIQKHTTQTQTLVNCAHILNVQSLHTHTQPNWKLHELISVPHSRSRTLTSVLEKSADTLYTCPPCSVPTPLLCLIVSVRDNSLVSCPVLICRCKTAGSVAVSGGHELHVTRGHWLIYGSAFPSWTKHTD